MNIRKFINNKKVKGSYAVEAALVLPIVIGMLFAMIYVLYFLHDKAVLYGNMKKAVVNVAEGTKEYKSNEKWQEDMQKNLWLFNVNSGEISKNKLHIKSFAKAECNLNIPVIKYFITGRQNIEVEDKHIVVHPEYMVRVKDIFSKEDKN